MPFAIPSATERAWAAGFFDGEGTAGATYGKYLYLTVSQTETTTLERFRRAVGGIGGIYAISTKGRPANWKQGNYWRSGKFEEVQIAICLLWEFLSQPKRDQIAAAVGRRRAFRAQWPPGFHPGQRVSDALMLQIRAALDSGTRTQKQIAQEFGIAQTTVSQIHLGRRLTTFERSQNWRGRRREEAYHLALVDTINGSC